MSDIRSLQWIETEYSTKAAYYNIFCPTDNLQWLLSLQFSGACRLRDAIVLGYQLQRIPGKDIAIPEWYSLAQNELRSRTQLPNKEVLDNSNLTRQ